MIRLNNKLTNKTTTAIMLAGLCSFATSAVSQPAVNGNTISWPDNGWYQVQNASDLSTVCEGGTQCSVDEGIYIVINHSLQQRFDGIQVGNLPVSNSFGSITVEGNVLSWPANGWYQVQNAVDLSTVCEGGTSCTVTAGHYIVINHTLGQRIELVIDGQDPVIDEPPVLTNSELTIAEELLLLPGDGWYQVQNKNTLETVCEGLQECRLDSGFYIVINHTTGQRWDNVYIPPLHVDPAPTAVINADNYRSIVKQALEVYSGHAYDTRMVQFPYYRPRLFEITTNFNCTNGGTHQQTVITRRSSINDFASNYTNCEWNKWSFVNNDWIDDGAILNGRMADTFTPGGNRMTYEDFSVHINDNTQMEVDGEYSTGCCSPYVSNTASNLNYYFTYPEGTLRVTDANTSLRRNYNSGTLSGSFTMQHSITEQRALAVTTDIPLTYDAASIENQGDQRHLWAFTSGVMRITATDDSSSVTIDLNTGNHETYNVLVSNDEESFSQTVQWGDLQDTLVCNRASCAIFGEPGVNNRAWSYISRN